jgi:hypothetical protein
MRRESSGWIRLGDRLVPIGNRYLSSTGVVDTFVWVSPPGTAVLSGEIPSVNELSEDSADLPALDIDRWSNIGAREFSSERPGFLDDLRRGFGPRFNDISTPDDGKIIP